MSEPMDGHSYQPSPDVITALTSKILIMVVGPTSIGKSSLMNEVVAIDNRFKRVSGFTTREQRANDEPGMYRYASRDESDTLIREKKAVQFMKHPTTGMIYGSEQQDYAGHYNLLDTISTAVDDFRYLPFARTVTISVAADPDTWHDWLLIRFPEQSEERMKRLIEAKQSIEWSLAQRHDHHWLINRPGELTQTAKQLILLATRSNLSTSVPPQATKLLKLIENLLSYKY